MLGISRLLQLCNKMSKEFLLGMLLLDNHLTKTHQPVVYLALGVFVRHGVVTLSS